MATRDEKIHLLQNLDEGLRREAERKLHVFIRLMWKTVEPARPFMDNWHIGAICLPGNSWITTERGLVEIKEIVETRWSGNVLSWNHKTNRPEWRPVIGWMKSKGRRVRRIKAGDGNSIVVTDNHPVFVNGSYARADGVTVGDRLVTLQALRERTTDQHQGPLVLQSLVFRRSQTHTRTDVCRLQEKTRQEVSVCSMSSMLRSGQNDRADAAVSLLRERGLQDTSRGGRSAKPEAWRVLWLHLLRRVLSWAKQFSVLWWTERRLVSNAIQENQAIHSVAGRISVRRVWLRRFASWDKEKTSHARSSSCRLGQGQLRRGQSSDVVQAVSREARLEPCQEFGGYRIGEPAVVAIDDTLRVPDAVYNIEVSGNNNYFAGGVLVHNCEHLEAVRTRQIKNLLINQPPATMKSVTVSVMFPAWCWATADWMRFMCLSYDQSLSTRDNVRMRNVIESPEYQARWPVRFSPDQNEKTKYQTMAGGWRIGTSLTGRIVGEHPHGKIVDDPHNTKAKLLTERDILDATEAWDYGLSTRGATMGAWTVLLMQRLHEKDLSGHVLMQNIGSDEWTHLCLPMRYEPPAWVQVGPRERVLKPRMATTPIGWNDPRKEPGELLWPAMWPAELVDRTVRTQLGPWGEAGQFQQRPTPAGGLLFQRKWFTMIERAPANVVRWVRFWDVAGTEGGTGARTAGVKIGKTTEGRYVIDGLVVKGRWTEADVEKQILMTARLDGVKVAIREEQEPGSSGLAVIKARLRSLAGYDYVGIKATGDKVTRARPLMVQAAGGNVDIVVGDEFDEARRLSVLDFFNELETFPLGSTRDQVDAAAGGFNELTQVGDPHGLLFTGANVEEIDAELERLRRELGLTPA